MVVDIVSKVLLWILEQIMLSSLPTDLNAFISAVRILCPHAVCFGNSSCCSFYRFGYFYQH